MVRLTETFKLTVRDRSGLLFSGDVLAVSSYNDKGPFDVLAQHGNFIAVIEKRLTLRLADGKTKEIPVDKGVMHVKQGEVNVFMGVHGEDTGKVSK